MGYSTHPSLPAPDPNLVLWRYMDFAKLVSLIGSRTLWFARADHLSDPHEGAYGSFNASMRPSVYPDIDPSLLARMSDTVKSLRAHVFISCWHANEVESMAMWSSYAPGGVGIAVRTTVSRVGSALQADDDIYGAEVQYVDPSRTWIPEGNVFYPFVHKRRSFESEREVRFITDVFDEGESAFATPPAIGVGLPVPCDVEQMIEAIHVAPGQPQWYRDAVEQVVTAFGLHIPVLQSSLDGDPIY